MAALRIHGLQKRYGPTVAVRDLSLTVERGQLYGLLGPNGSGKTTTLSCALGLLAADAGTLEVLGERADRIHRLGGRVAAVFDGTTLVPGLSVRQNLAYARRLLGHRGGRPADEALELVGIADLAGRKAGRLSLGQSRRLSIARALLGKPELLVLDEPLSGLDTVGVRDMLTLFSRLAGEGLTLVLSSHRLHELERIVSHCAVIMAGRVVAEAPLDELLGGVEGELELSTADDGRARQLLAGLGDGTVLLDGPELVVRPGPQGPGAVTRRLVEGGCDVLAAVPRRRSLQTVFESLLDEHLDGSAPA